MNVLVSILKLISRLPLGFLYLFSDFFFLLNHYIIGYRKKVVLENLRNSFQEKSDKELKEIEKKFFKNFFDYMVETFKALTISETELRVRMQHINQDLFHEAKAEGKNIIFLAGHVFNWEWITALAKILPQENSHPVYRKVNSSFWNDQIVKVRNRFGNKSLEDKEVLRHILRNPNNGNSTYMFVADQSPEIQNVDQGLKFLNQMTPVFIGYDKLATRMDLAFIYCEMKKVKRGYYQINYHRIYPDDEKFREYEVVKKFHHLLNDTVTKRPDNYLWTHRRWKHSGRIKTNLDLQQ